MEQNNIDNIDSILQIPASLAPMAGFSDPPFRRICFRYGAKYAVSEMISSVALVQHSVKTGRLSTIDNEGGPVVLQLFGHDPHIMGEAADMLLSGQFQGCRYFSDPAGIDINMGCPVRKIFSSGDGSALMSSPSTAYEIVREVRSVCEKYRVPLSVKFRLGVDESHKNYEDFGVSVAEAGADKLTLHCRTRTQMYSPPAFPESCIRLRAALDSRGLRSVKICGNGDIVSRTAASVYLNNGCSEVAVGRAALSEPWIFKRLLSGSYDPEPGEIISVIKELVERSCEYYGETTGIRESRSRAGYLIKGYRGSARLRNELNHADSLSEFIKILDGSEMFADHK